MLGKRLLNRTEKQPVNDPFHLLPLSGPQFPPPIRRADQLICGFRVLTGKPLLPKFSSAHHKTWAPSAPKAGSLVPTSLLPSGGVGILEGPDPHPCGVGAAKNTHHRPSTWRKKGSGAPALRSSRGGGLGGWVPQEASNRVGRNPVSPLPALATSARPSGRITWQGWGQIKQEHDLNNFQGRLL